MLNHEAYRMSALIIALRSNFIHPRGQIFYTGLNSELFKNLLVTTHKN